jgi:hypothetical protein
MGKRRQCPRLPRENSSLSKGKLQKTHNKDQGKRKNKD